jgi:hypothetical protein
MFISLSTQSGNFGYTQYITVSILIASIKAHVLFDESKEVGADPSGRAV